MTTREFADRPFAAGSLIGLRSFWVEPTGQLRGPSYPAPFDPGVNEAACYDAMSALGAHLSQAISAALAVLTGDSNTHEPPHLKPSKRSQLQHHQVGDLNCFCGFYAYTGTEGRSFRSRCTVDALIEGFGVCTLGDLGFRASKARLVALVDPAPHRFSERRKEPAAHNFAAVVARYGVPVYRSVKAALREHPLGALGGV